MKSRKSKIKIPTRRSLFWDTDPKTIDPKKHAFSIVERIMDFGLDKEVRWMWQTYPRPLLHEVARKSRSLRPETKSFWELITKKS